MTTKKTYYVLRDIDEEARKLLSEDDVLKAIMLAARKNNWI